MATATIKRPPATPEDVWATLDRIARMNEEFKKEQREERRKEQEEQQEERRKQREEQREERAKYKREEAEAKKKRDEGWAKLEKMFAESAEQIKSNNKEMGRLRNSFGELAEHLVAPGIAARFDELGLRFGKIAPDVEIMEDGQFLAEVDLLLENADTIMAVEIKAKVKAADINEHKRRLAKLRDFNEKMGDRRRILGAVAGAVFGAGERNAARNAGFYVVVQSGDTMKMDIPEGFVPKVW